MYSKSFVKRAGAAALSLVLAASLLPMARAADPVVDESYYATLDYYGGLMEGSVVKSYRLNGNTDIADIGTYSEVNNLTDRTQPVVEGDRVTFHLTDDSLKNFYFEGKTDKPFKEMPFLLSLSYRMNGVETDPEDMAGQTGLAEITLDVKPNPLASAYQRNNFALEAAVVLKDSDLLSIEAPGGQLQKVGDLDTALFLVLPGETRSFTLRVGSEDFTFPGFTFLVEPATLAQLDQIKDLKEAKEELEGAAGDISDSMDAILTSLEGMDGDLRRTASGLDQLDRARAIAAARKAGVYDQADRALDSLTDLTESLKPVVETIQTAKTALTENTEQLVVLTGLADQVRPDLMDVRASLESFQGDLDALQSVLNDVEADSATVSGLLSRLEGDINVLQGHMDAAEANLKTLRDAVEDIDGVGLTLKELTSFPINGKDYTPDELRSLHDNQVEGLYTLCTNLPSDPFDDSQAVLLLEKETLFTKYILTHADEIAQALVLTQGGEAIQAGVAQALAEQGVTPETVGPEAYAALFAQACQEEAARQAAPYAEQLSDEGYAQMISFLHYQWTEGVNVEEQLGELNTFNGQIEKANDTIGDLNKKIRNLRDPTADLLADAQRILSDLDGDTMNDVNDLLAAGRELIAHATAYDSQTLHDHASGLLTTGASLLERVDGLIAQTVTVSETLTKYEPEAQSALDDAIRQVSDTVALLSDLNTFSKSLESLMQAVGPDLDSGSAESLQGLSSTLRRASDGLGTTSTVRKAKDTVTRLVEDKWEEYTGGENNLLNIDSQAEMISLTSPSNPTPNTITMVLRSQEIKVDEETRQNAQKQEEESLGFWGRVGRMFHDFIAIFTGD